MINGFMNALSSGLTTWLSDLSLLIPLGYAFGAGMVSSVNPCGFAMLPAYLGLYIGSREDNAPRSAVGRALWALLVSVTITAGFVVLFALVGGAITLGGRLLIGFFPWAGVAVGVALALLGLAMVRGYHPYASLGQRLSQRLAPTGPAGLRGFFLFGLAYGTASLSCTLPIFLTVVGTSVAVGSLGASFGQFVLYALGMGSVILALSLSLAAFKEALATRLRLWMPRVHQASAALLLLAGAYIVYYWFTEGGLLG